MSDDAKQEVLTLDGAVARCQIILAHAWMVRTFVKHSEVVEDFPELMHIVRTVFDTCRALETRKGDAAHLCSWTDLFGHAFMQANCQFESLECDQSHRHYSLQGQVHSRWQLPQ